MSSTSNLKKRGRGYYARVVVPAALRNAVGRNEIVRTLKTGDLKVAQQRRWAVIAKIHQELQQVAKTVSGPLSKEALSWRDELASASEVEADVFAAGENVPFMAISPRAEHLTILGERVDDIRARNGDAAAQRFRQIALGQGLPISLAVELWLDESKGRVTGQSLSHYRFAGKLLQDAFPDCLVEDITRREAASFTKSLVDGDQRTARTARRIVSNLGRLWRYLIDDGHTSTSENPWTVARLHKSAGRAPQAMKRSYSAAELQLLLDANPCDFYASAAYADALFDLPRILLMTGARLNEICSLEVGDVDLGEWTLAISDGKTKAARRVIPVHKSIQKLIRRRVETAIGGFLFHDCPPGGADMKRGHFISQAFTKMRRRILPEATTGLDFHSFRRNFLTYLERAAADDTKVVNPYLIAELAGHQKPGLAMQVYSGGLTMAKKRRAIEALDRVIEPPVLAAVRRPRPVNAN